MSLPTSHTDMSHAVWEAVSTFKKLAEIPSVKTAEIYYHDPQDGSKREERSRTIRLTLSSRSYDAMTRMTHRPTIALGAPAKEDALPSARWCTGSPAVDAAHDTIKATFTCHPLSSTFLEQETFTAVLRETPTKDSQQKRRTVELWTAERCAASVDVTEAHGAFFTDDIYSSLSLHADHVLYTAQANTATRIADVTKRPRQTDAEKRDGLEGYEFQPPLGSLYTGQRYPTTFLLKFNLSEHRRPQLFHIDPSRGVFKQHQTHGANADSTQIRDALLSQATFNATGQGIVMTSYPPVRDGRRLGLVACTNRPSIVCCVGLEDLPDEEGSSLMATDEYFDGKITASLPWRPRTWRRLSHPRYSGRTPSLGPRGAVYWLESESGGAHRDCDSLVCWQSMSDDKVRREIAIQAVPDSASGWPGLFCDRLPRSCALFESGAVALTTIWGSRRTIVIHFASPDGRTTPFEATPRTTSVDSFSEQADGQRALWSYELLCTDGRNLLLAVRSSPGHPQQVILGRLHSEGARVNWTLIRRIDQSWIATDPFVRDLYKKVQARCIEIPGTRDDQRHGDQAAEAILLSPHQNKGTTDQTKTPSLPCILMPHGGPHSSSTTDFLPSLAALCLSGYCIVLPNYHGSLGKGQQYAHSLLGKCGTLDVEDCRATMRYLMQHDVALEREPLPRLDANRLFVDGGSHGGFLALHLVGQYPSMFRAAICRNPVTSAHVMEYTNDIPDWFYSEFGLPFDFDDPPSCITTSQFERLANASPFAYLDAIQAPVLLLVGLNDQRVAPSQAKLVYHALLSRSRRRAELQMRQGDINDRLKAGQALVRMLTFEGQDHPLDGVEAELVSLEARVRWVFEHSAS